MGSHQHELYVYRAEQAARPAPFRRWYPTIGACALGRSLGLSKGGRRAAEVIGLSASKGSRKTGISTSSMTTFC